MTAEQLADELTAPLGRSGESTYSIVIQAATMLRKQSELLQQQDAAIRVLREALEDTAQTLVWMQWGDCRKFTQRKLLTVHEAVAKTQAALAATEKL